MKRIIEIDLTKLEIGTRTGKVRVQRDGKVFYREQRLGRKEQPKKEQPKKDKDVGAINKWIKDVIDPIDTNTHKLWDEFEDIKNNKDEDTAQRYYSALVDHESFHVRGSVVNYLNDEGKKRLMNDPHKDVRYAVAYYTHDSETIIHLSKDFDRDVKIQARSKYYDVLLRDHSKDFLAGKDVDFESGVKNGIRDMSFDYKDEVKAVHKGLDSLYSSNDKYSSFNDYSKEEWLKSSNNTGSAILKHFIKQVYSTTDIQHHDSVDLETVGIKPFMDELSSISDINGDEIINYVKLQKNLTKKLLDIKFPNQDEFTVYRGTSINEIENGSDAKPGDEVVISQNPISSWTLNVETADKFADNEGGVVIEMKVSKDDIWSSFLTHSYSTYEQEMVVLGKENRTAGILSMKKKMNRFIT